MRHLLRTHRQDLMNPDRLSELVLIVILVGLFALLLAIIRDLAVLKALSRSAHLGLN
jgi:hypothetical protein